MASKLSKKQYMAILVCIVGIILNFAINFFTNIFFATSALPAKITPYVNLIYIVLGVAIVLSILLAILGVDPSSSPIPQPAQPIPIHFNCPHCGNPTIQVHGAKGNTVFLICSTCGKVLETVYKNGNFEKMIIFGIGIFIGTEAVANVLNENPDILADFFASLFDVFS